MAGKDRRTKILVSAPTNSPNVNANITDNIPIISHVHQFLLLFFLLLQQILICGSISLHLP